MTFFQFFIRNMYLCSKKWTFLMTWKIWMMLGYHMITHFSGEAISYLVIFNKNIQYLVISSNYLDLTSCTYDIPSWNIKDGLRLLTVVIKCIYTRLLLTETAQRAVCNKMIAATERNTLFIYFFEKRFFKCISI